MPEAHFICLIDGKLNKILKKKKKKEKKTTKKSLKKKRRKICILKNELKFFSLKLYAG